MLQDLFQQHYRTHFFSFEPQSKLFVKETLGVLLNFNC